MSEQLFYIDIENSSGTKYGSGPITGASIWEYTARMDRTGSFRFVVPATDEQAAEIQRKRVARAWALVGGAWTEVGAGIIDNIVRRPQADGRVLLDVSGEDLTRELAYRSVKDLKLYLGGNPVTHSAAVTAVAAYAPAGWTITADAAPPNDSIYGRFNGETVLAALIKIAEKTQNHFYRSADRTIVFASSFTASGVRAIQAGPGDLAAETCAIVNLSETIETHDLITRIYPRGSGNGDVQLTLQATTQSAPAGFTLDTANNYIENDTAEATYGVIEQFVEYREIGPISNTDADVQAAADMLFTAALEELRRRSTEAESAYYDLALAGCGALLRPLQSLRVVYRDEDAGVDIDETLNILETTWRVDASGVQTTSVQVTTADRWPQSDTQAIVDSMTQGTLYQAHPQLNANSYVTAYRGNIDELETATFRFRFGDEVVQLQQVLLEFQLLPFESTVRAVGGATSGSGDIDTSGPSTDATSSGGNNETGSGGPTETGSGGPTGTGSAGSGDTSSGGGGDSGSGGGGDSGSGGPTETGSGGTASTDGTGTLSTGLTSLSIDANFAALTADLGGAGSSGATALSAMAATGGTGTPSTNASGAPSNDSSGDGGDGETGGPEGSDIDANGDHQHTFTITLGAGSVTYPVGYGAAGTAGGLVSTLGGSTHSYPVNLRGDHTHSVGDHTHSLSSHTHSLNSHTHDLGNHTHSLANHTHGISNHTHEVADHTHTVGQHTHAISTHGHSIASHTHSVAAHTHTVATHTHTVAAHTHTVASHTHSVSAHTHSVASHTHSMAQHTHTLNNHTHDLSESLTAIYGIFREDPANTFAITDLRYRVNAGTWVGLDTATDIGDSWWRLDLTADLQSATTLRPARENNTIEIGYEGGVLEKTVTIDAQLSVRNIIQAIAYV